MLLAQITDLHMRRDDTPMSGEVVTRPYIEAAVEAINTWTPDAVFVTGDLTDVGSTDEYTMLRTALDGLTSPYYLIPGNHDRHANLRATFDSARLSSGRRARSNWIVDDYPGASGRRRFRRPGEKPRHRRGRDPGPGWTRPCHPRTSRPSSACIIRRFRPESRAWTASTA